MISSVQYIPAASNRQATGHPAALAQSTVSRYNSAMNDILSDLSEHISVTMHFSADNTHPGGWREERAHEDYDIWIMRSGAVHTDIAGRRSDIAEGDVFLMPPAVRYRAWADEPVRFACFHFDCSLGMSRRSLSDLALAGAVPHADIADEAAMVLKAWDDERAKRPMGTFLLRMAVSMLFARIAAVHLSRHGGETPVEGRALERMKPAINHIAAHLNEQISAESLAAASGMAVKYFSTCFKRTIGITPRRYIERLKMNRAREYLAEERYSVGEVAALLGFADQFSFSKAFKKFYRVSPTGFMRAIASKG